MHPSFVRIIPIFNFPDGRHKVGLMAAPEGVIRERMKTCGLAGVYGDPAREYAGGYLLD